MAKVDEQTHFFMASSKVIQQLPLMFWPQIHDSLQLDYHGVFDNHIRHVMPNDFTFIIDIYRLLTFTF